jgi:hypothetical protein
MPDADSTSDLARRAAAAPADRTQIRLADDILDDMIASRDYPLAATNRDALHARLTTAVLECADRGERDPAVLRRRVIEIFRAPLSRRTAA